MFISVSRDSFNRGLIVQLIIYETKNVNLECLCLALSQVNETATCESSGSHEKRMDPAGPVVKNPPANAGDRASVTGKNKIWLHVGSVSFTLTCTRHCFCSLKGYRPYIMSCIREPWPPAWMLNQSAFVQEPVHLWMATGRRKLIHSLPEAGHSRRYLQDLWSLGASPVAQLVKNLPASAGDARDVGSIPGTGRVPGEGNGNPLQYSCLENSMDRWASPPLLCSVKESGIQTLIR